MLRSRKLVLRKETLTELTNHELKGVAAAVADSLNRCLKTFQTCVTCVDTLTIATCQCPTGPTCFCPTEAGC